MHLYIHTYLHRLRVLARNKMNRQSCAFLRVYIFWLLYTIGFVSISLVIAPSRTGLAQAAGFRVLLALWTIGLVFVTARFLNRRPVHAFGLNVDQQWMTDGFAGIIIGAAIPTGTTIIGLTGGWFSIVAPEYDPIQPFVREICLVIVVTACIAVTEEIVFRGYILTNAIEGFDLRWLSSQMTIASAWSISTLLFASTHPSPTLVDRVHFLGAGFLLGLAYLLTGEIALPIGIHTGFNFASTYLFSTAQTPPVAVVPLTVQGPAWLTGQTGLVQTGLLLPAVLTILVYVWWQYGTVGISPKIKSKPIN